MSPAQKHVEGSEWWTDYQPVSYILTSKCGNRSQYQNMITTCHAAGVKVIAGKSKRNEPVDRSSSPTRNIKFFLYVSRYDMEQYDVTNFWRWRCRKQFVTLSAPPFTCDYPGIYNDSNSHHCGLEPGDNITMREVWTCQLSGLA